MKFCEIILNLMYLLKDLYYFFFNISGPVFQILLKLSLESSKQNFPTYFTCVLPGYMRFFCDISKKSCLAAAQKTKIGISNMSSHQLLSFGAREPLWRSYMACQGENESVRLRTRAHKERIALCSNWWHFFALN